MTDVVFWRRLVAEFVGTAGLVTVVVGSGIMAATLSPGDTGLRLLENSIATALGLTVLILITQPISGGHLNPVVSAGDYVLGRRTGGGLTLAHLGGYVAAQTAGAIAGSALANLMFARPAVQWSTTGRAAPHLWLGELVATAGLVLLVFGLTRTGRTVLVAPAVGAYIGAAYWATSSTSFANPAATVGRAVTDTFAGIAPSSVPGFVLAQLAGLALGTVLVLGLYPSAAARPRRGGRRTAGRQRRPAAARTASASAVTHSSPAQDTRS